MPFVGSLISAKQAAPPPARPKSKKERAEESGNTKRLAEARDEAELSVEVTEQVGTERKIAENASEESAEDRAAQVYYGPGQPDRRDASSTLDLEG